MGGGAGGSQRLTDTDKGGRRSICKRSLSTKYYIIICTHDYISNYTNNFIQRIKRINKIIKK